MRFLVIVSIAILAAIGAGAYVFLRLGFLSFSADQSPSGFEQKYAMAALDASTKRHAIDMRSPVSITDANLRAGLKLYKEHCSGCHGDPSDPQRVLGKSFYPPVPQFMKDAPDMSDTENFYIIKHGIRWTGMPAWGSTLSDDQIWKLTAFLSQIEKLPASIDQEWKKIETTALNRDLPQTH